MLPIVTLTLSVMVYHYFAYDLVGIVLHFPLFSFVLFTNANKYICCTYSLETFVFVGLSFYFWGSFVQVCFMEFKRLYYTLF